MSDGNDYDVGYGRPPKEHQFKKGQSGNARGRKRKKETNGEIVAKVRDELIPITLHGRQVKITAIEAAIRQTLSTTLRKGNPRDLEKLLLMLGKYGDLPEADKAEQTRAGAEAVMTKISTIVDRLLPPSDPAEVAAREEITRREADIIMTCPRCARTLQDSWDHTPRDSRGQHLSRLRGIIQPGGS